MALSVCPMTRGVGSSQARDRIDGSFTGLWCGELELAAGGGLRSAAGPLKFGNAARVLIRLHGVALGYLTFPAAQVELTIDAVRRLALSTFEPQIARHLQVDGIEAESSRVIPGPTPGCPSQVEQDSLVSVVVCTRNRSEMLTPCLDRLAVLTYATLEILIVDNAPSDDRTRQLIVDREQSDDRFRYVLEPRPGLSVARNRGVSEARGRWVAFTDDDVAVDPDWIQGLVRAFESRDTVGCVTGLVCTAGISNAAEAYFDARSPSWSSRCVEEEFDLEDHQRPGALYPYSAGIFGTGANFAFDRGLLAELGPFDEALGAGTRTKGGEDLDMFVRVLHAGRSIVYQPAAVVWHHHRADEDALRSQMFGYGSGLSAYLTKWLLDPAGRWDLLRRVPVGVLRISRIRRDTANRMDRGITPPRRVWAHELAGFAAGPWLYLRARRAANLSKRGHLVAE